MFIASRAKDDALWHLGVLYEVRGDRTGKLISSGYRAACGRSIGGSYGYSRSEAGPLEAHEMCKRCLKIMAKDGLTTTSEGG